MRTIIDKTMYRDPAPPQPPPPPQKQKKKKMKELKGDYALHGKM